MNHQKEFQKRLIEARKLKNWSQSKLASKAGFEPSAISHFESGRRKPSFKNLIKLAQILMVTLDYLVGNTKNNFICKNVWARPEDWPEIRRLEKKLQKKTIKQK